MEDSKLENVLRKAAIALGGILLIASIYLSYDGFDQQVGGGNEGYSLIAVAIGYALALACTLLQFIVASKNENLNSTLRWLGISAYAYSIATNYLGLTNLLEMDKIMAGVAAAFMDIAPEQMIAWGLGEAVMHDLFGNLGKFATEPVGKSRKGHQQNQQSHQQGGGKPAYRPNVNPEMLAKLGKGNGQVHTINQENRGNSDKFRR